MASKRCSTSGVIDALGMDILGVIPKIGNGSKGADRSTRQALEAFRDLRVNLEFAYSAGKPLAVTLTSPDESEGKSTLVANLATCFGAVGRRTLVVDGDTRRGDLHRILDASRKPGLTDFLVGDAPLDETVQSTKFRGVHLIGSGSRSQASPELLGSRKLGDLVGELWKRYDVILVDSPPLGAGAGRPDPEYPYRPTRLRSPNRSNQHRPRTGEVGCAGAPPREDAWGYPQRLRSEERAGIPRLLRVHRRVQRDS